MKRTIRAGIAALALTAFAAQPVYAAQANPLITPNAAWMVYGFGVMFCTGLTFGKQDVQAAKWGKVVTHKQRLHGLLGCAFPPIGLAKLVHGQDW